MWSFEQPLHPIYHATEFLIVLLIPFVLIMTSTRILMQPKWLSYEYTKPNFPQDDFGFGVEERLHLGEKTLNAVVGKTGIDYLAATQIDHSPVFNQREIVHLEDVAFVIRIMMAVHYFVLLFFVAGIVFLLGKRRTRQLLPYLFISGGILTLTIISAVAVAVFFFWEVFFDQFHQILFKDGSWLFYEQDALIRLFPEQFWVDSAAAILIFSSMGGVLFTLFPKAQILFKRDEF